MAKRNKLGEPKKKFPGYKAKSANGDYDRRAETWYVAVPLALVGDARTFSMEGAVPEGDRPGDPRRKGAADRWRVDRDGKSFHVIKVGSRAESGTPDSGHVRETYVIFSAERKCENGTDCPLTRYWCQEIDFTLTHHRPGTCPAGVPGPGTWKRERQIEILTNRG